MKKIIICLIAIITTTSCNKEVINDEILSDESENSIATESFEEEGIWTKSSADDCIIEITGPKFLLPGTSAMYTLKSSKIVNGDLFGQGWNIRGGENNASGGFLLRQIGNGDSSDTNEFNIMTIEVFAEPNFSCGFINLSAFSSGVTACSDIYYISSFGRDLCTCDPNVNVCNNDGCDFSFNILDKTLDIEPDNSNQTSLLLNTNYPEGTVYNWLIEKQDGLNDHYTGTSSSQIVQISSSNKIVKATVRATFGGCGEVTTKNFNCPIPCGSGGGIGF